MSESRSALPRSRRARQEPPPPASGWAGLPPEILRLITKFSPDHAKLALQCRLWLDGHGAAVEEINSLDMGFGELRDLAFLEKRSLFLTALRLRCFGYMNGVYVTDAGLACLAGLTNLTRLNLGGCK